MKDDEKLSLAIYDIVLSVRNTLSLPTHKTLEKTLYYSLALFGCSLLSELIGFYTFISWQGCLICIVLIIALLFIERSENDALLKMYRTARVSAEKAVRRAKTAGTSVSSRGRANIAGKRSANASKRKRPVDRDVSK